MLIDIGQARLQLGRGDHLRLSGACGTRLTTINGIAWITVDRDAGDTLIHAGDSFVVPSERTVLVSALFSSLTLDVQVVRTAIPGARGRHSSVGEKLRALRKLVLRRMPKSVLAAGMRSTWHGADSGTGQDNPLVA